ncbi:hypothetical protein EVAR_68494_1 [Eumeta japonica]|uniref:Uncharacterized protein n=1 Tax=Eumeta variegata TaxID=151549 RepID=A0A4C1ZQZ5_EUMVA|nr:hypothetical protein EVAR_68494_1 [Eumeta japonica]
MTERDICIVDERLEQVKELVYTPSHALHSPSILKALEPLKLKPSTLTLLGSGGLLTAVIGAVMVPGIDNLTYCPKHGRLMVI